MDPGLTFSSHLAAGMSMNIYFTCIHFHVSTYITAMNTRESTGSNLNQPPTKRRKLQIACTQCRDRKTRCDGARPVCSTCDRRGKAAACVYEQDEIPTLQYGELPSPVVIMPDVGLQVCAGHGESTQATRSSNTWTSRSSSSRNCRAFADQFERDACV